jgi:hypothetical protein
MGFAEDIRKWEKKALEQINTSMCKAFEEVAIPAVVNSPSSSSAPHIAEYSKNHLIEQWYPQIGGFSGALTAATNAYGAGSITRIKELVKLKPFYGRDNFVTLTNNTPYAYRAEVLGWPAGEGANGWQWSGRVGPYGMITRAVITWKAKYQ